MKAHIGISEGTQPAALALIAILAVALTAAPAGAGQAQGAAGGAQAGAYSALETQRLFDAYVLVQAQDSLDLRDAQLPDFIRRLKVLQDVRRRHLLERRRIVLELQRRTGPGAAGQFDEARVRDLLRSLADVDATGADEVRKAQEALDETLDLRQRARFRVFEDQVERRKLDLLLRARRAVAGRGELPKNGLDKKK